MPSADRVDLDLEDLSLPPDAALAGHEIEAAAGDLLGFLAAVRLDSVVARDERVALPRAAPHLIERLAVDDLHLVESVRRMHACVSLARELTPPRPSWNSHLNVTAYVDIVNCISIIHKFYM